MHNLTLKSGKKTTEFLALVGTVTLQWVAVSLTVLTDIMPVIPEDNKPWVLIAVSLLTSLQATVYSAKRSDLKQAAVEATAGYNLAVAQIAQLQQGATEVDVPC